MSSELHCNTQSKLENFARLQSVHEKVLTFNTICMETLFDLLIFLSDDLTAMSR